MEQVIRIWQSLQIKDFQKQADRQRKQLWSSRRVLSFEFCETTVSRISMMATVAQEHAQVTVL